MHQSILKTPLEQEDIQAIAQTVVEMLKPFLHSPQHQEDEILSLAEVSSLIEKRANLSMGE
jgi:hypothetical protein